MTDLLLLFLVSAASALAGGLGGGLVAALALRREEQRYDARLSPLRDAVEDLDDRLLSWQRKVTKRERDALRSPRSDDQASLEGLGSRDERLRAIRARALAAGIARGGKWAS